MQAKMNDGAFGPISEMSQKGIQELLKNEEVEHVEVFEATPKELKKRKKYKISRGFKKTPRIG